MDSELVRLLNKKALLEYLAGISCKDDFRLRSVYEHVKDPFSGLQAVARDSFYDGKFDSLSVEMAVEAMFFESMFLDEELYFRISQTRQRGMVPSTVGKVIYAWLLTGRPTNFSPLILDAGYGIAGRIIQQIFSAWNTGEIVQQYEWRKTHARASNSWVAYSSNQYMSLNFSKYHYIQYPGCLDKVLRKVISESPRSGVVLNIDLSESRAKAWSLNVVPKYGTKERSQFGMNRLYTY